MQQSGDPAVRRELEARAEGGCEACGLPLDPSEAFVSNGVEPALLVCATCAGELGVSQPTPNGRAPEPGAPEQNDVPEDDARPVDDLELCRMILTRLRAQGLSFDEAWPKALDALPPLADGDGYRDATARDREMSQGVLCSTREWWRLSYERLPIPPRPQPTLPMNLRRLSGSGVASGTMTGGTANGSSRQ